MGAGASVDALSLDGELKELLSYYDGNLESAADAVLLADRMRALPTRERNHCLTVLDLRDELNAAHEARLTNLSSAQSAAATAADTDCRSSVKGPDANRSSLHRLQDPSPAAGQSGVDASKGHGTSGREAEDALKEIAKMHKELLWAVRGLQSRSEAMEARLEGLCGNVQVIACGKWARACMGAQSHARSDTHTAGDDTAAGCAA